MTEPRDIYESIDQMIDLCGKKVETLRELKRALRIADLLGMKPAELKGIRVGTSVTVENRLLRPWRGAQLVVSLRPEHGEAERRMFPLEQVSADLWPDDIREAYERHTQAKERVLARSRRAHDKLHKPA